MASADRSKRNGKHRGDLVEIRIGLLTRKNVKMAASIWRREPGYGGFQDGRRYEIVIGGRGYPVKAIVAIALELAGEPLLAPSDFPGRWDGRWHRELKALRFKIRVKGDYAGETPEPAHVSVEELLEIITGLGAPVVITKNKNAAFEKNFRVDPSDPKRWLDGNWSSLPVQIDPRDAFVLHWVIHKSLVCIGQYCGSVQADGGGNCLILNKVHFYHVTEMSGATKAHKALGAILKQNGPVTYSYYRPGELDQYGTPAQRRRLALARLAQPAFRDAVMAHYGHRCVVTNCATLALLDAAHLPGRDWRLGHNRVSDGIPLRTDLHRALDRRLIRLNKRHQLVWVSRELNGMYDKYLVASKPGKLV